MHFVAQHVLAATTLLFQLEDDEAVGDADRLGDFTHGHAAEHLGEVWWQLGRFTPTHLAAFQGVFAGGAGDGQLAEVRALLELLVHLAHLACSLLDVCRVGGFRGGDQDVGQAVLFRHLHLAHVGVEEVLHFLLRHLDALGHAALAHAADDHLALDLVAGVVERQAVMGQRCAELVQRHAVALGNGADGLVQFFVGDANAGAFANLQLQVFDDQAFQYLLFQGAGGRHAAAALGDGLLNLMHALVQLALHDHVVVDDGHHAIKRLYRGMHRATQQSDAQQHWAQSINKLGLHVHGNLECLGRGKIRPCCQLHHRGLSGRSEGRHRGRLFRSAEGPG